MQGSMTWQRPFPHSENSTVYWTGYINSRLLLLGRPHPRFFTTAIRAIRSLRTVQEVRSLPACTYHGPGGMLSSCRGTVSPGWNTQGSRWGGDNDLGRHKFLCDHDDRQSIGQDDQELLRDVTCWASGREWSQTRHHQAWSM